VTGDSGGRTLIAFSRKQKLGACLVPRSDRSIEGATGTFYVVEPPQAPPPAPSQPVGGAEMVTGVIIAIVLIGGILQRIGSPERYLSRTEKLLRGAGHALEFRFAPAVDGKTAKHMEAQRLMDCEREHLRTLLPGSNS